MGTKRVKKMKEAKNRHSCQYCGRLVNSHDCLHTKCSVGYLESSNYGILDFSLKRMIERLLEDG